MKGVMVAVAISLPLWAAIIYFTFYVYGVVA